MNSLINSCFKAKQAIRPRAPRRNSGPFLSHGPRTMHHQVRNRLTQGELGPLPKHFNFKVNVQYIPSPRCRLDLTGSPAWNATEVRSSLTSTASSSPEDSSPARGQEVCKDIVLGGSRAHPSNPSIYGLRPQNHRKTTGKHRKFIGKLW